MAGDLVGAEQVSEMVGRHLHMPFAAKEDKKRMRAVAERVMEHYLHRFGKAISQVILAEKPVEIRMDGMTIQGRIDHMKCLGMGEESIVEQKTADDAQVYDATRVQLLLGALG